MRMEEHKAQYRASMSARLDDAFKAAAEDRVVVPNPAQLRNMARAAVTDISLSGIVQPALAAAYKPTHGGYPG